MVYSEGESPLLSVKEDIFISYRVIDTSPHASRLHKALTASFGQHNVFYDVQSIRLGEDWDRVIRRKLEAADSLIVLIGKKWVEELQKRQQSIEIDYVVVEIATKLKQMEESPMFSIFPLLVDGAAQPKKAQLPSELHGLLKYQMRTMDTENQIEIEKLIWDIRTRHYPNRPATLSFWRPPNFIGSDCTCIVHIDGDEYISIKNGDRQLISLPPGEYELYIRYTHFDRSSGRLINSKSKAQKFTILPGETYRFLCRPGNMFWGRPQLNTEKPNKLGLY